MADKEIKYINKDYTDFKSSLINFAKVYYPNSYNDFNEGSPGMLFIEAASYVGDVLSFYLDNQLKEMMMPYAEETKNVIALSQAMGRKPILSAISTTTLDVFQVIPATGDNNELPEYNYALKIENLEVSSEQDRSIVFRASDDIDFSVSNDFSPTEITVYELSNNIPSFYLLKKSVPAVSGKKMSRDFYFGTPEKYSKLVLPDSDIIEIISVISGGYNWYEVPYLSQETITEEILNTSDYDPMLSTNNKEVPFLLRIKKVPRRYITKINSDGKYELQFGSGVLDTNEDIILQNSLNIRNKALKDNSNLNFLDPSNFLKTSSYGLAPSQTTLTVTYVVGTGDINLNVAQGDLVNISNIKFRNDEREYGESNSGEVRLLRICKNSVGVINSEPAIGASSVEGISEIRDNAMAFYASQGRAVTKADYAVRVLSMNPKYGKIAKAFVANDTLYNNITDTTTTNMNTLNLFCLCYDRNNYLTQLNAAIKQNIKTYLSAYRISTDAVNIIDAYIINIGIRFEIYVKTNYNKKEVIYNAIQALKTFFNIQNWQIGQPIIMNDVYNVIEKVDGVKFCPLVEIECKYNGDYSINFYDIKQATINEILYPSLDPSIFEVKYPGKDIVGKAL